MIREYFKNSYGQIYYLTHPTNGSANTVVYTLKINVLRLTSMLINTFKLPKKKLTNPKSSDNNLLYLNFKITMMLIYHHVK